MDSADEKKYNSIRGTIYPLFMIAFIIYFFTFRKEFLPEAFSYLALLLLAINLMLIGNGIRLAMATVHQKQRRRRTASMSIKMLGNIFLTVIIILLL